jgi:TolB protein
MNRRKAIGPAVLFLVTLLLPGCGGGSGGGSGSAINGAGGVTQMFGALTTRVVGTAQPPVISNSASAGVTGIAGASVTSLIQNRTITLPTVNANTRIAYYSIDGTGKSQIFTVGASGGAVTPLTTGATDKYYPAWSPDGTKIAYHTTDATGYAQLFTVAAAGGTPVRITTGTTDKFTPSWSPDGTRIAYTAADSLGYTQVCTMPAGGGAATQLTTGSQYKSRPSWSPDGTRLAYSAADGAGVTQIFTVAASGGAPTQLTTGSPSKNDPSWSPDGAKIAYDAYPGTATQIFTVPVAALGGGPTQLTAGDPDKYQPSWSPDGSRIAYFADDGSNPKGGAGYAQIFTMPAGGGTPTQVTFGSPSKYGASWSPLLTSTKPVSLIGNGGLLASSAAGFLFAQSGDAVLSVLSFDTAAVTAASRAGARAASLTPVDTQNPNLVFSLTAGDSLSSLRFVNYDNASGTPGKVIAPPVPAGTTGALVSFNAVTGKVTTVLPYAANRNAGSLHAPGAISAVQVSRQGAALALRGRFLAVYDCAGENRAMAQGANTVLLDAQTGQIIAVQ